jgi:hypothetical protein
MLAKCPQCDASWRVRGIDDGKRIACPFCTFEFSFHPLPGSTVSIPREQLPQGESILTGEDTVTAETGKENLLGVPELPSHLRITLHVLGGTRQGETLEVTKSRITLGRGAGDIDFRDLQISRKHAVLEIYGDRYILLRDLASTNGTFVNDMLISQAKVEHGDTLRLGFTAMRLDIERREP